MEIIYALLLLGAAVCFFIAMVDSVRRDGPRVRVNLVALGLGLWVLVEIIQALSGLNVK